MRQDDINRMQEIRDEIEELAGEALRILRANGEKFAVERAKAYWYGHIMGALGDTDYIDCMATMQQTIDGMSSEDDEVSEETAEETEACIDALESFMEEEKAFRKGEKS